MKSHFIHKAFLNEFVKGGELFVYDKNDNKVYSPLKNANKIAFEYDLYKFPLQYLNDYFMEDLSLKFPEWNEDCIERALKVIEDKGITIVKKIISKENLNISEDEKIDLFAYFIVGSRRTPAEKERIISFYEQIFDKKTIDSLFIQNLLNKKSLNIEINTFINNYDMFLLKNNDNMFLLSDNPFYLFGYDFVPNIFIPINHSLGIIFKHKKNKDINLEFKNLKKEEVNEVGKEDIVLLNCYYQLLYAKRWVFGRYPQNEQNLNCMKKMIEIIKY